MMLGTTTYHMGGPGQLQTPSTAAGALLKGSPLLHWKLLVCCDTLIGDARCSSCSSRSNAECCAAPIGFQPCKALRVAQHNSS